MNIHDPDPDPSEDFDGFTARLSSQPPAALPEHWRVEILAAARLAAPAVASKPRLFGWMVALMWPHPWAYATLALVWLLILALRCSIPAVEATKPRQVAGEIASADDPLAAERTRLAINTVLFASPHRQEALQ